MIDKLIDIKINYFLFHFRAGSFNIKSFSISYDKSAWYEYFKCGVQGIHDKFPDIKLKGINEFYKCDKNKIVLI